MSEVTPANAGATKAVAQASIASFFGAKGPVQAKVSPQTTAKAKATTDKKMTKPVVASAKTVVSDKAPADAPQAESIAAEKPAESDDPAFHPVTPAPVRAADEDVDGDDSMSRLVSSGAAGTPTTDAPTDKSSEDGEHEDEGEGPTGPMGKIASSRKKVAKTTSGATKKEAAPKKARKAPAKKGTAKKSTAAAKKAAPAMPASEDVVEILDSSDDADKADTAAEAVADADGAASMDVEAPADAEKETEEVEEGESRSITGRVSKASQKKAEAEEAAAMEVQEDMAADDGAVATPESKTNKAGKTSGKKAGSAKKAASAKREGPPPLESLPEDTQAQIAAANAAAVALLDELETEEATEDVCDNDLEVDAAITDMVEVVTGADTYVEMLAKGKEVAAAKAAKAAAKAAAAKAADPAAEKTDGDVEGKPEGGDAAAGTAAEQDMDVEEAEATEQSFEPLAPEERVAASIKTIIARAIQGRSDPLSKLGVSVSALLGRAQQLLEASVEDDDDEDEEGGGEKTGGLSELMRLYRDMAMQALQGLLSSDEILLTELKAMACREVHGLKPDKASAVDPYEDEAAVAIWRWEVVETSYFSKTAVAVIREAKATRRRYGAELRALTKLAEQLGRSIVPDLEKIGKLEATVKKCKNDIAAARKKRQEDRIKAKAAAEKKKVAAKAADKKKEEREVAAAKKRAEAAAAKEAKEKEKAEAKEAKERERAEKKAEKMAEEEEAKAAKQKVEDDKKAKVAKQASFFTGFLKPVPKPSPAKVTPAAPKLVPITADGVVDLTATPASKGSVSPTAAGAPAAAAAATAAASAFDTDAFIAKILGGMTAAECVADKSRFAKVAPVDLLKTLQPRGAVTFQVTVAGASTGFGQEGYAEQQDVSVDAHRRTFLFCDDFNRPGYYGTRSKSSVVITGRSPFTKDFRLVNYDFDSDDEYEDVDGEDIGDSDDEEDEGGNDLEYNDFFRHDNDFGSDADSDGEVMAAVAMSARQGRETVGPRFLRDENGRWCARLAGGAPVTPEQAATASTHCAYRLAVEPETAETADAVEAAGTSADAQPVMRECAETEKDTARLRAYGTVVFASVAALPFLGWTEPQPTAKLSKKDAAKLRAAEEAAAAGPKPPKEPKEKKAPKEKKPAVPKCVAPEHVPALAALVHGSKDGCEKLVLAFCAQFPEEAKAVVTRKIKEIAEKKKAAEGHGTARWVVHATVLTELGLTEVELLVEEPAAQVTAAADGDAAATATATATVTAEGATEAVVTGGEAGTAAATTDVPDTTSHVMASSPVKVTTVRTIAYTPPRVKKRVRPEKVETNVSPPKSARLRGDEADGPALFADYWPEPAADAAAATTDVDADVDADADATGAEGGAVRDAESACDASEMDVEAPVADACAPDADAAPGKEEYL